MVVGKRFRVVRDTRFLGKPFIYAVKQGRRFIARGVSKVTASGLARSANRVLKKRALRRSG